MLELGGDRGFGRVVFGDNRGANVGNVAHLSGTVGAAMEALFQGVPAVVVSQDASETDYTIAAAFTAIEELCPWKVRLEEFQIVAAGSGRDAVGEVHLQLRVGGNPFAGRAASLDVVDAAARAFLNALDKADHARCLEEKAFERMDLWAV